jgi:hypothetical protein
VIDEPDVSSGFGSFPDDDVAELVFCDVWRADLSTKKDAPPWLPDFEVTSHEGEECWSFECRGLRILARSIHLRRVPRPDPRSLATDRFIPVDDAVPASQLDETWRMCEQCMDAWRCPPIEGIFAYCPKCFELTMVTNPQAR